MLAAAILAGLVVPARADSTIDPAHPYAYGANLGWVNARGDGTNGAIIGQSFCTGCLWSANAGWLDLGRGPTNGWRYGNAAADDWGVNHDGEGRLSGCAYGANVGWVVFEQTHGSPKVDLRTGVLSGFAWGANIGWIGLSNLLASVRTETLDPGPDTDHDQLADAYEYGFTNVLTALSGLDGHDADGDGVTDLAEAAADTDPLDGLDYLRIVSLKVAGRTNWVAWTARPTRLYRLEATNTLRGISGIWEDAGGGLIGPPAASPFETIISGVTAPCRFYRVRAIVPLSD